MELAALGSASVLRDADVMASRERSRQARFRRAPRSPGRGRRPCHRADRRPASFATSRATTPPPPAISTGRTPASRRPTLPYVPGLLLVVLLGVVLGGPLLMAGRSPHVLYRPEEIGIGLADVVGADAVVEEVIKTLNLFLGHRTFEEQMGGTPRRAVLFEGPSGDRQDLHRQGDGGRGGRAVPVRVLVRLPVHVLRADQPQDPVLLPGAAALRPARGGRHRLHRGDRRHRRHPGRAGGRPRARRHRRRGQRTAHTAAVLRRAADRPQGAQRLHRRRQPLAAPLPGTAQAGADGRPTSWSSAPPTAPPTSTRPCCARAASTAP